MKVDATPPPRPAGYRKQAVPNRPGPAASRHDHSLHSPDEIRVDVTMPADPDSHDGPDFHRGDDEEGLDFNGARVAAQTVSAWLATHALSIANHNQAHVRSLLP